MKRKNQVIYSEDQAKLKRLQEEYTMIGFDTKLINGKLIVFAKPRGAMSRKQKRQAAKRNRAKKTLTQTKARDRVRADRS